jgi:predicted alpha/beta-hydrolase family hydrolase
MEEHLVSTPVGTARLDWYRAVGSERAVVVLGHGTATGVEAKDLQALARALPPLEITVVLVTQPYRLKGNWRVANEQSLDQAWGHSGRAYGLGVMPDSPAPI